MTKLTLASKSAARAQLLRGAGVAFDMASAGVNEDALKTELLSHGTSPAEIAGALADSKALAVAWDVEGLVIGADQTLDFEGRLFDKAASIEEARERLRMLRGRPHKLHSAISVARGNEILWRETETATLHMRDFSEAWLEDYLQRNSDAALTSVGCYQLEGEGVQMFDHIDGDYFVILGLPLFGLLSFLRRQGVLAA